MTEPRILITISRIWTDWDRVKTVMGKAYARTPDAVLIHGDEKRGDRRVAAIWEKFGGMSKAVPADWDNCDPTCRPGHRKTRRDGTEYCPAAGHRRNALMVQMRPDLVVAFIRNRSRGASNCAELADAAGLRVVPYTHNDTEETP